MRLDRLARVAGWLLAWALLAPASSANELAFVAFGTGPTSGNYYPIGRELCALVNRENREHGVRCSVEATVGSVYNVDHLRTQELDLAIIQADVVHDAVAGVGRWSGQRARGLLSVVALYPEVMTVLAGSDAGIAAIDDLAGRRVNIGSRGTGSRAAWEVLEQALGWTRAELAAALELRPAAADEALCMGTLDASVQVLGQPSARVAELLARCPVRLVDVNGPAVDRLLAARPYLRQSRVPGDLYGGIADTETYGGMAVVMASRRTPDRVVTAVVLAVADHLEELRTRFPILRDAELPAMLAAAAKSAPPHPGVAIALQRRGLGP